MIYSKNESIKQIFNINFSSKDIQNHMDEWYYNLIQKVYDELDIADVSRMIVQKIFITMAANKAIDYLKKEPISGQKYDGELLELLYSVPKDQYEDRLKEVEELLIEIKENVKEFDWLCEEDCEEYCKIIQVFQNKLW